MTDPRSRPILRESSYAPPTVMGRESTNLGDILERVLDRGIVIAGDIRVNLLEIELLTIKLRLVIASVDTAREIGIDWWERDPWLSGRDRELVEENRRLRERLSAVEERLLAWEERTELEPGERAHERAGERKGERAEGRAEERTGERRGDRQAEARTRRLGRLGRTEPGRE
ncbi:gas vesicle protein [Microbispora sp. KK1-11]|uniref:gas vesicle protein n=1 Tax=Microbispora sp. KK1-11 TaxID=2053005 RepID=UPI00115B3BDF|nr:gas vesicle protein [Microbispora sp. KK1-11]TQS27988.1 gas vesicle protein [Microbispora sp. KK1-11]